MPSSLVLNSDLRIKPSQSAGDRNRNTYLPQDTEASESRDDKPLKRGPEEQSFDRKGCFVSSALATPVTCPLGTLYHIPPRLYYILVERTLFWSSDHLREGLNTHFLYCRLPGLPKKVTVREDGLKSHRPGSEDEHPAHNRPSVSVC